MRKREKPRAGLARFSSSSALLPRLLGASTPSFWGRERDRLSRARTKTGSGMALAMHFLFRTTGDWMPQGAPNDDRHPEARNGAGTRLRPSHRKSALADLRTINASRAWPTCALLIRSRVNPRPVGDGPGLAAHPSLGCEPSPHGGSKVP